MYMPKSAVPVSSNSSGYMPKSAIPVAPPKEDTFTSLANGVGTGIKKGLDAGIGVFSRALSSAADLATGGTERFEETQRNKIDIADKYLKAAIELNKQGKKAQADELFRKAREVTGEAQTGAQAMIDATEQGKRDTLIGGAKTALLATGAPAMGVGTATAGAGIGAGLEAGRQAFSGEKFDANKIGQGAGQGVVGAAEASGVTRFTNPVTQNIMSSAGNSVSKPIAQVAKATVGGLANIGEDVALNAATGRETTGTDLIGSFALGAAAGGFNKAGKTNSIKDSVLNPTGAKQYSASTMGEIPGDIVKPIGTAAKNTGKQIILAPFKAVRGLKDTVVDSGSDFASTISKGLDADGTKALDNAKQMLQITKDDLVQNDRHVKNLLEMSDATNVKDLAYDAKKIISNGGKIINDSLTDADTKIGTQPVEEIIAEILEPLRSDSVIRNDPTALDALEQELRTLLTKGMGGNETNLTTMNNARTTLNNALGSFYNKGQQVNTAADTLDYLKAKTSFALKNMLSQSDPRVRDIIEKQHSAIVSYPVLSKLSFKPEKTEIAKNARGITVLGTDLGRVASPLIDPFAESTILKSARSGIEIDPEQKALYRRILNYGARKTKNAELPEPDPNVVDGAKVNVEPIIYGESDVTGTALDQNLISPFTSSNRSLEQVGYEPNTQLAKQISDIETKKLKTPEDKATLKKLLDQERDERLSALFGETSKKKSKNQEISDTPSSSSLIREFNKNSDAEAKKLAQQALDENPIKDADNPIKPVKKQFSKQIQEDIDKGYRTPDGKLKSPKEIKESDSLAQEARKYKSAEEFVKAQQKNNIKGFDIKKPLMHGGTIKNGDFSKYRGKVKGGIFFTDDIGLASAYAGTNGEVTKAYLDIKNPKIYQTESEMFKDSNNGVDLISQGYDGLIVKDKGFYSVFDSSQIKTKSQLTNIYNQANSSSTLKPFVDGGKSNKSKTTNIQARYAKETPKSTETGRRNVSAEIVKRAIETKGATQKKRLLADFPSAKNPEKMSRAEQDKFLRASKSRRYN